MSSKLSIGLMTGLNFLVIGVLFGGLSYGLIIGLIGELFGGLNGGPIDWLIVGLTGGLIIGLNYGGDFLLKHILSRFLLYRSGYIPWNLVTFLDFCTDRIFLRRVGGGYIFIHRMLMEHFVAMATEEAGAKVVDSQMSIR